MAYSFPTSPCSHERVTVSDYGVEARTSGVATSDEPASTGGRKMARTDLAERVAPRLHGLSETAGSAAAGVAGAWRERGAPAASTAMTTLRERAMPTAATWAKAARARAVPAVRDHAIPAAVAASVTVRNRAKPAATAMYERMQPAATSLRERLSPAPAEPKRTGVKRLAHGIAGGRKRRMGLIALVLAAAAAAGMARRRAHAEEPYSAGYPESLNGAHEAE